MPFPKRADPATVKATADMHRRALAAGSTLKGRDYIRIACGPWRFVMWNVDLTAVELFFGDRVLHEASVEAHNYDDIGEIRKVGLDGYYTVAWSKSYNEASRFVVPDVDPNDGAGRAGRAVRVVDRLELVHGDRLIEYVDNTTWVPSSCWTCVVGHTISLDMHKTMPRLRPHIIAVQTMIAERYVVRAYSKLMSSVAILFVQVGLYLLKDTSLRYVYVPLARSNEPWDLSPSAFLVPIFLVVSDLLEVVMTMQITMTTALDLASTTASLKTLLSARSFRACILFAGIYFSFNPFVRSRVKPNLTCH